LFIYVINHKSIGITCLIFNYRYIFTRINSVVKIEICYLYEYILKV